MYDVFDLVHPVYDIDTYTFKLNVVTKRAKYEYNTVLVPSLRIFNMQHLSATFILVGMYPYTRSRLNV